MKPRGVIPKLSRIAEAWAALPADEIAATFPDLRSRSCGWGEPFCFRCGWMPPVRDTASYPVGWHGKRGQDAAWNAAVRWLERAHLHDHVLGGGAEPDALVPLCVLCHEQQPVCASRDEGVAFVNTTPAFASFLWLIQLYTDEHYTGHTPDPGEALRKLLRAHAAAGTALLQEMA